MISDNALELCLKPGSKLYDFFSVTKRDILKKAGLSVDVMVAMDLDEDPKVLQVANLMWDFLEKWAVDPQEDRNDEAMEVLKQCMEVLAAAKAVAEQNNGIYPKK